MAMNATADTFQKLVIEASAEKAVLVDFWAPWCGPCQVLGPVLEELEGTHGDRFSLVKVDTEREPSLAAAYRISSIPAVKLIVDGVVVDAFTGTLPKTTLEAWLMRAVPSKAERLCNKAAKAFDAGDTAGARDQYLQAHQIDPSLEPARAGLARLCVLDNPKHALELVAGIDEGSVVADMAQSVRVLARLHQVASDPSSLGLDPKTLAYASYVEGATRFTRGQFEPALKSLIESMRHSRKLDDDGARHACVALFCWLGDHHPLSVEYRRVFSSALY